MDNLGVNIVVHTHADYAFLLLPKLVKQIFYTGG